jgi:hypothetical protein
MAGRALRNAVAARTPPELVVLASRLRHGETGPQRWATGRMRPEPTGAEGLRAPIPFSALETQRANLRAATDALTAAGVQHAVLEAAVGRRPVVVVPEDPVDTAETVDVALADGLPAGFQVAADRPRVQRVWSSVRAAGGRVLAGPELGCDVELWPVRDGTAWAPRPNRWAEHLTVHERRPVEAVVGGETFTTYDGLLRPHVLDVGFPVDAVYTWVDGSDPAWLARKDAAWSASGAGPRHPLSANASRFASREELRYSLRSLEMYAGWVRHVYLVTDQQVPDWLRRDHPRLTVVDHRDIFPAGGVGLPTFNSHAIEARLHHIEGLADHYLYLNDDVFFGRPVAPELFFLASGASEFFLTPSTIDLEPASAADMPVDAAAKVSRQLIEKEFDRVVTMKFQHVVHPQRRDVMADLEARFADEMDRTVSSPFRQAGDVSAAASLSHYFGFVTERAVPGRLSYLYCDIDERRAPIKLQRLARDRDADMFCLNDVGGPARGRHDPERLVRDFLSAYFPVPSSFEGL